MKKLSILMTMFAVLALASCNKDDGNNGDDNPPVVKKGIMVNEVMIKDTVGLVYIDAQSDACDWAEFYNDDDKDVNLAGYYLSDKGENADDADKWEIPTGSDAVTTVGPGKYLVIVFGAADASGNDLDGIINDTIFCPSGLSSKKDEAVALFDDSKKFVTASEVFSEDGPLGKLDDGKSLGRKTDGDSEWMIFDIATPGTENK